MLSGAAAKRAMKAAGLDFAVRVTTRASAMSNVLCVELVSEGYSLLPLATRAKLERGYAESIAAVTGRRVGDSTCGISVRVVSA